MKIIHLAEAGSTNDDIKSYLGGREDVVLYADRQTAGRGTKGRSFLSGEGGVYLSHLKFYKEFPAKDSFLVMARAAVAVCKTAERFGLSPEIKWPNDVLLSGKKLAGILIENMLDGAFLTASITGIGLNVQNDVSSLGGIAISLSEAGADVSLEEARAALISEIQREHGFAEYLSRVKFLGKEIKVTQGDSTFAAVAKEICPDGRLKIEAQGEERILSSAEIKITL